MKQALITGIIREDGSHQVKFLLEKGYRASGLIRRSNPLNFERIAHI